MDARDHGNRRVARVPAQVFPAGSAASGGPPPPVAAGQARAMVREVLDDHYGSRGGEPVGTEAGDALLVTSELVTNAFTHGEGLTAFSAHVVDGELMLQVTDHSPLPPHVKEGERGQPGGFGWGLAGRLCRTLYVRPLPDGGGKTIVACLPL